MCFTFAGCGGFLFSSDESASCNGNMSLGRRHVEETIGTRKICCRTQSRKSPTCWNSGSKQLHVCQENVVIGHVTQLPALSSSNHDGDYSSATSLNTSHQVYRMNLDVDICYIYIFVCMY